MGAVGVMAVGGVLLLGLAWSRTSLALIQSFQAAGIADACVEEALGQVRKSLYFSGNGTATLAGGSCAYTVTKGVGQARTIVAAATVGTVVRKVNVSLSSLVPAIIVTSWQEVP